MTDPPLAAVVMAGGLGTRMRSAVPKHLHELLGRPLIEWVLAAVEPLGATRVVLVCSPQNEEALRERLGDRVEIVLQDEPLGTGHSVACARSALEGFEGDVLVVPGDTPLLREETLAGLLAAHRASRAAVTLLSFEPPDARRYGRVVRDASGAVLRIVEAGDATENELAIREVNASVYAFASSSLWPALAKLEPHNVQGELYLTDAVAHLTAAGERAAAHVTDDWQTVEGVNTRVELADAMDVLRHRILRELMLGGATVIDPGSTWIDHGVTVEPDAVIHPFTVLRGSTSVGAGAQVGPQVVAVDAEIGPAALVGPFCYLRPGTVLREHAKAGTFVELKNSTIGRGSKVPHLSYIGDADVGEGTNIGAGAITANYRAELGGKFRTRIGDDVHTGSHNVFVAPVEIGDGAWVGAGSTITKDVPPGALAVARARQLNKEGYRGRQHD